MTFFILTFKKTLNQAYYINDDSLESKAFLSVFFPLDIYPSFLFVLFYCSCFSYLWFCVKMAVFFPVL